jgi:hypothetical protein
MHAVAWNLMPPVETPQPKLNAVRRSQRVLLSMPVVVSGTGADGQAFQQGTHTVVVSAHGALVLLRTKVTLGQVLTIRNVKTNEQRDCRVSNVTANQPGQMEMGLEFLQPSPRFWHIAFPPPDWSSRSEEAKRFNPRPGAGDNRWT